jgi:hypothetical protein
VRKVDSLPKKLLVLMKCLLEEFHLAHTSSGWREQCLA